MSRPLIAAALLMLAAAPALAQEAKYGNPGPTDFSQPWRVDGNNAATRFRFQDVSLPVEVTTRQDLLNSENPAVAELTRAMAADTPDSGHPNCVPPAADGAKQNPPGVSTIHLVRRGDQRFLVLECGQALPAKPASDQAVTAPAAAAPAG